MTRLQVTAIDPKTKTITLSGPIDPKKGDVLTVSPSGDAYISQRLQPGETWQTDNFEDLVGDAIGMRRKGPVAVAPGLRQLFDEAWETAMIELRREALRQNPMPGVAICPHALVEVYCPKCGGWGGE